IATKESEALVDSAIEAGKVAPANREMYLATCRYEEGRKQFAEFVKAAPVIVSKTTTTKKESTEGHASLSDEDLAMCRHMGISEEEFLSVRKQEK
ncbi:phage protease, partial [Citrobacter freundii]|nr:peptidase [Citrobacter freundii]